MSTLHQYVYVSFSLDGVDQDHVEERLDDLAEEFDGKCCGSGTAFLGDEPRMRDLDYSFYDDASLDRVAAFMDAVYAEFPFATARLGSQSHEKDTDR